MNTEKKLWFKAKKYGYGWYPSSWEGWTVIAAYLALAIGAVFIIQPETEGGTIPFVAVVFLLSLALIFVSYKKGEKPRWRWGDDDLEAK